MIINNNEIDIVFPNNIDKENEEKNQIEFLEELKFDSFRYRLFKENINRNNNIDNEINYMKFQKENESIDFVKNIIISNEEYNKILNELENLNKNFTEEIITDIIFHKKLLSNEKHILEIFTYFLGYKYFDWKNFRENFNLYDLKIRIEKIEYNKISKKKINLFLNRICRNKSIEKAFKNNFNDNGMEIIFDWVRCQIKIFIYLFQNKLISYKSTTNDFYKKSKTNNNFYKDSKKYIEDNSTNKNNIDFTVTNWIKENENQNDTENVLKNKISNQINRNTSISDMLYNESKNSNKINSQNLKNNLNNLLVTSLPIVNNNNNNKKNSKFNSTKYSLNSNKTILYKKMQFDKNNIIQQYANIIPKKQNINLNVEDFIENHIKREEQIVEMLPLLKYRTFHQMRQFYNLIPKIDYQFEKKHKNDVKLSLFNDEKSKQKILLMLSKGKGAVLKNVPSFRLKKIVSEN